MRFANGRIRRRRKKTAAGSKTMNATILSAARNQFALLQASQHRSEKYPGQKDQSVCSPFSNMFQLSRMPDQ